MTATTPAAHIACCKGPMLNVHKSCSHKAPRQTRSRDCWCSTGRVRERKSQRYNMHAAAPTTRATATQVPAKPCTYPVSRRHNQTAAGSSWRSQETALPSFWSCCLQPEVTVAQHEHSTGSAQAQHKLSKSSAQTRHRLSINSAQAQHELRTSSALPQHERSASSAQAQHKLRISSASPRHEHCPPVLLAVAAALGSA
jgi:hypothetical protein